jgi:glycine cleavage system H protein
MEMTVEKNLFYTKDHEWVKLEGNQATIGITDYAQHALGDITFVELPSVGSQVKQQEAFTTVESVKAASDIYAPLSGKITKVNEALEENPEAVNSSPYGEGWIAVIEISDESEKKMLIDAPGYEEYIKSLD